MKSSQGNSFNKRNRPLTKPENAPNSNSSFRKYFKIFLLSIGCIFGTFSVILLILLIRYKWLHAPVPWPEYPNYKQFTNVFSNDPDIWLEREDEDYNLIKIYEPTVFEGTSMEKFYTNSTYEIHFICSALVRTPYYDYTFSISCEDVPVHPDILLNWIDRQIESITSNRATP